MTGPIPLDLLAAVRTELRQAARALAEAGVPADAVLDVARAGIADAVTRHARSGR